MFSVKSYQRGSLFHKPVDRYLHLTISSIFSIYLKSIQYFPQPIHPPLTFNQYSILQDSFDILNVPHSIQADSINLVQISSKSVDSLSFLSVSWCS